MCEIQSSRAFHKLTKIDFVLCPSNRKWNVVVTVALEIQRKRSKYRIVRLEIDVEFYVGIGRHAVYFASFAGVGAPSLDFQQCPLARLHRPQALLDAVHDVDLRALSQSEFGVAVQKLPSVVSSNQSHYTSTVNVSTSGVDMS